MAPAIVRALFFKNGGLIIYEVLELFTAQANRL